MIIEKLKSLMHLFPLGTTHKNLSIFAGPGIGVPAGRGVGANIGGSLKNILARVIPCALALVVMPVYAEISGTVQSADGETLIGATIQSKTDPTKGVTTNGDGVFTLPDDFPQGDVEIRFIGYTAQTLTPSSGMKVTLKSENTLDEVVVQGHSCAGELDKNKANGVTKMIWSDQTNKCVITECQGTRWKYVAATSTSLPKCEDQYDKRCENKDPNANGGRWREKTPGNPDLWCEPQCKKGYYIPSGKTSCEKNTNPCSEADAKKLAHATETRMDGKKCIALSCENGYKVEDGKCKEIKEEKPKDEPAAKSDAKSDEKKPADKTAKSDSKDTPKARTAEEKKLAQDRIAELKDNAQKMKEKENSFENKLLGATGMLTVGQGGQDWAAGSAEKKADDAAERSMRAYLETFRCTYGGGTQVKGGEKNVILPGGNALMGIYTEYITRAQELKATKESLGMRPGIESEMVIDKANSGLYDDVAIGKTGGAFASVYRALTDPTSDDAKRWNEQKAESEKRAKSGKTMAIAGAAATGVASVLLNKNAPKESSEKINNKYDKMLQDLQAKLDALPKPQVTCPNNAKLNDDGTCNCAANQVWNSNSAKCETCEANQVKDGNSCVDKPKAATAHAAQPAQPVPATTTPQQTTPPPASPTATTPTPTPAQTPAAAPAPAAAPTPAPVETKETLTVPSASFKHGISTLEPDAAAAIAAYAKQFADLHKEGGSTAAYCINVIGKTDKTGTDTVNNRISNERAQAVAQILTDNGIKAENISAKGVGSTQCETPTKVKDDECRVVTITPRENACSAK